MPKTSADRIGHLDDERINLLEELKGALRVLGCGT